MNPAPLAIPNNANFQPAPLPDDENPPSIFICNIGRTRESQMNREPKWDSCKTALPSSLTSEFIKVLQVTQQLRYLVHTAFYSYEEATIIIETQAEDWPRAICADRLAPNVGNPPSPIHPRRTPSLKVTCFEVDLGDGGSLDQFVKTLEEVKGSL